MHPTETARLRFRALTPADTSALHAILGDPETMRFYPAPYDRADTRAWIDRSIRSYAEHGCGLWAVVLKAEDRFIGQCGIMLLDIDGEPVPEIAYHIRRDCWNRGYATEAARASLRFGFESLDFPRLWVHTYVKNVPSQRIAAKIGMKRIREYDKYIAAHDLTWRHVVFAMGRSDYRPARGD